MEQGTDTGNAGATDQQAADRVAGARQTDRTDAPEWAKLRGLFRFPPQRYAGEILQLRTAANTSTPG